MKNLLKYEFFKFFRSTAFYVLLIVLAVIAAINALAMILISSTPLGQEMAGIILMPPEGKYAVIAAFADMDNLAIIFSVVTALIITADFHSDTIKNTVMYKYSRQKIFTAKSIAQAVIIFIMLIAYVAVMLLFYLMEGGWGETFTLQSLWENVIKVFLLGLPLSFALTAFFNFIAYYTKSTVLVIVSAFVLSFIAGLISAVYFNVDSKFWETIMKLSYINVIPYYMNDPTAENFIYYIIITSLLLFPSVILSILKFQKQEI